MADEQPAPSTPRPVSHRRWSPALVGAGLLVLILVVFVLQNGETREIRWLFFDAEAPQWLVILVSALIGYLLGQLVEFSLKRRRRTRQAE